MRLRFVAIQFWAGSSGSDFFLSATLFDEVILFNAWPILVPAACVVPKESTKKVVRQYLRNFRDIASFRHLIHLWESVCIVRHLFDGSGP